MPDDMPGTQQEKTMHTHFTQLIAKGFSLAVLGFIAAVTFYMAISPADSLYSG